MNILLGMTGSVACLKAYELVEQLQSIGNVQVVATKSAKFFLDKLHKPLECPIYYDEDEWQSDYRLTDPILHIELRKWADMLVVAPLTANTLAKMANGMCDNLLTSVMRAWDYGKPFYLAPSMNTAMLDNRHTKKDLGSIHSSIRETYGEFKYGRSNEFTHDQLKFNPFEFYIPSINKKLACGDVGFGAMEEPEKIVEHIQKDQRWILSSNFKTQKDENHPSRFAYKRKNYFHTGVDFYCGRSYSSKEVYAVESGRVVGSGMFTGPELGHDHWLETHYLMIEGASGVINYGEIQKPWHFPVGRLVARGYCIGHVAPVLKKTRNDIEGHSDHMLHLELYKKGTTKPVDWKLEDPQPENLLDPTPFILNSSSFYIEEA